MDTTHNTSTETENSGISPINQDQDVLQVYSVNIERMNKEYHFFKYTSSAIKSKTSKPQYVITITDLSGSMKRTWKQAIDGVKSLVKHFDPDHTINLGFDSRVALIDLEDPDLFSSFKKTTHMYSAMKNAHSRARSTFGLDKFIAANESPPNVHFIMLTDGCASDYRSFAASPWPNFTFTAVTFGNKASPEHILSIKETCTATLPGKSIYHIDPLQNNSADVYNEIALKLKSIDQFDLKANPNYGQFGFFGQLRSVSPTGIYTGDISKLCEENKMKLERMSYNEQVLTILLDSVTSLRSKQISGLDSNSVYDAIEDMKMVVAEIKPPLAALTRTEDIEKYGTSVNSARKRIKELRSQKVKLATISNLIDESSTYHTLYLSKPQDKAIYINCSHIRDINSMKFGSKAVGIATSVAEKYDVVMPPPTEPSVVKSYSTLQNSREMLEEVDNINDILTEYPGASSIDILHIVGMVGVPIQVERSEACMIDPWKIHIADIFPSTEDDTASLYMRASSDILCRDPFSKEPYNSIAILPFDKYCQQFRETSLYRNHLSMMFTENPDLYQPIQEMVLFVKIYTFIAFKQLGADPDDVYLSEPYNKIRKLCEQVLEKMFSNIDVSTINFSDRAVWRVPSKIFAYINLAPSLTSAQRENFKTLAYKALVQRTASKIDPEEFFQISATSEPKLDRQELDFTFEPVCTSVKIRRQIKFFEGEITQNYFPKVEQNVNSDLNISPPFMFYNKSLDEFSEDVFDDPDFKDRLHHCVLTRVNAKTKELTLLKQQWDDLKALRQFVSNHNSPDFLDSDSTEFPHTRSDLTIRTCLCSNCPQYKVPMTLTEFQQHFTLKNTLYATRGFHLCASILTPLCDTFEKFKSVWKQKPSITYNDIKTFPPQEPVFPFGLSHFDVIGTDYYEDDLLIIYTQYTVRPNPKVKGATVSLSDGSVLTVS